MKNRQGRAYPKGAKAESLVLKDGQALAESLRESLNPPAGGFVALPGGCTLFAAEEVASGEQQAVGIREPCGIPEEATALQVTLRATSPSALRVKAVGYFRALRIARCST